MSLPVFEPTQFQRHNISSECGFLCAKISSFVKTTILMTVMTICWLFALSVFLVQASHAYNPFDQFGVYCKPEAYRQLVKRTGCDSQYIRVKACLGTCASHAYPLDHPPYFKKMCSCCKPSSTRWKVLSLQNCGSGISPVVQVESAFNCKCSECT